MAAMEERGRLSASLSPSPELDGGVEGAEGLTGEVALEHAADIGAVLGSFARTAATTLGREISPQHFGMASRRRRATRRR